MTLPQPNQVDLWGISVPDAGIYREIFLKVLSADETIQYQRFLFEKDRECFLAAHGGLRLLLSGYLGLPPRDIIFGKTVHGKPYLPSISDQMLSPSRPGTDIPSLLPELHFNLSHSKLFVLYAFTSRGPVGVDIEAIRPVKGALDIAKRFFSAEESEMIQKASGEDRDQLFFRIWTRKEAVVKAIGKGITVPLASFSLPGSPSSVFWEATQWWVQDLQSPRNSLAALALPYPHIQPEIRNALEYFNNIL